MDVTTFAVHYAYDHRDSDRDIHRPAHRAYLASLADAGIAVAYGRYDDDGAPGALLILDAEESDEVEELLAADPFMVAGLVVDYSVRAWPVFGPWASAG